MNDSRNLYPPILVVGMLSWLFFVAAATSASAVQRLSTFPGENVGDQFAISVCNAGDVDGNGYADLLIGASLEDGGGTSSGRCYLFLGSAFADTLVDGQFTGLAGEKVGGNVAGNGDLNGDGYADMAVAALGAGDGGVNAGKVYVFFGGQSPDMTPDLTLVGSGDNAAFGQGLALEGDLNGDGFSDLVVGAPGADSTGVVYVYFGGNPMDTTPDLILRGEHSADQFGSDVSTGGDVNADGFADLLVGAPRNSDTATWAGKAYIYFGGASMDSIADLSMTGETIADNFGSNVEICHDIDGDKHDDFLVSAPYYDPNLYADAGRVYIYHGGPAVDATFDGTLDGDTPGSEFGYALSSADVNGDSLTDIIVGAPNYGSAYAQIGKVYLYDGGGALPVLAYTDIGTNAYDGLGISVAGLGMYHFNRNGTREFVAGGWNVNSTGAAYLYGEPVDPTGVRPLRLTPEQLQVNVFPNPFTDHFNVTADLPRASNVQVQLFDVTGRKVADVYKGFGAAGTFTTSWNASRSPLPSGIYFLRVSSAGREAYKKVVVVK